MKKYGTFLTLGVFAAAMGILEAAVVVYLRRLYYPLGFGFPLSGLPQEMISVEVIREAATIVMLACAGALAGRDLPRKLAYFFFSFGAWDIFYYAGLRYFLGWPASLLTWDVLFLIPVPWLAPVLAPLLCALTMVLLSGLAGAGLENGREVRATPARLGLLAGGTALILYTFLRDGLAAAAGAEGGLQALAQYVPTRYNWALFGLGEALILAAAALTLRGALRGRAG